MSVHICVIKNLIFLKQVIKSACAVREFPSVWIWLYKIILPLICIGSWLIESHLTGRYFLPNRKNTDFNDTTTDKNRRSAAGMTYFLKALGTKPVGIFHLGLLQNMSAVVNKSLGQDIV